MGNLFKIFGKLKDSNNLNKQGVGLGLSICKKICQFMGGDITVSSQKDEGSKFTFKVKIDDTRKGYQIQ